MVAIARIFLLFQMSTVFPLLAYLYRTNLMSVIYPEKSVQPTSNNQSEPLQINESISTVESDIDDNDEQPLLVEGGEAKHDNRKLVHHLINTSIL